MAPLALLLRAKDPEARAAAAERLGRLGDRSCVDGLVNSLSDPEAKVRCAAAWALGELSFETAVPALITTLADADAGVRAAAVEALGEMGSGEAVPPLAARLADVDGTVRLAAIEALRRLPGREAEAAMAAPAGSLDAKTSAAAMEARSQLAASRLLGVPVEPEEDFPDAAEAAGVHPSPHRLAAEIDAWTTAEREHVSGCPQCQRGLALVWRSVHPSATELAEYRAGQAANAGALRIHLEEDRCAPCAQALDSAPVRLHSALLRLPREARNRMQRWGTALQEAALGYSGPLGASLEVVPSALSFGGEELPVEAAGWNVSLVATPTCQALSELYVRNGRSLPEEAEVYWGHEIWLVTFAAAVTLAGENAPSACGIEIRLPDSDASVIDVLPRPRFFVDSETGSACIADLGWNGTLLPRGRWRSLDRVEAAPDVTVELAAEPDILGAIAFPVSASAVAAIPGAEAAHVYLTGSPEHLGGVHTVCLLMVTDKYTERVRCQVEIYTRTPGRNGVPTWLRSAPVEFTLELPGIS